VHAATGGLVGNAKNPLVQKVAVTMANVSMDLAFVMLNGQVKIAEQGGAHAIAPGKGLALVLQRSSALANPALLVMIAARKSNA